MSEIDKVRAQIATYDNAKLLAIRDGARQGARANAAAWNPHLSDINRIRREKSTPAATITATRAKELSRAIVYLIDEEIARRGLK